MSQVESFGADHVLLPLELGLQPLQLLGGEDRPHPLGLALPAAPGTVATLVFWNKLRHQSHRIQFSLSSNACKCNLGVTEMDSNLFMPTP